MTALIVVCAIVATLAICCAAVETIRKSRRDVMEEIRDAKFRLNQLEELEDDIQKACKGSPVCAVGHFDKFKELPTDLIMDIRDLIMDIDLAHRMGRASEAQLDESDFPTS